MTESENEELASVLIRERNSDLPGVDIFFRGGVDKYVRIEATRRGLYLGTHYRRFYRDVYPEGADEPATDTLVAMVDAASGLIDQIDPAVQPILAFVQRIKANNPEPLYAGVDPKVSHVAFLSRRDDLNVQMRIDGMGFHSGTIFVGDRPLTAFDIGLHLNIQAQAEAYRADIQRIVAAAQPMIAGAREFARDMERFMPPAADD
jgi:hypothetical protein